MSIVAALLPLAIQAGLPLLTNVLEGKIGSGNTALIDNVVRTVAEKAGVVPASVPELIESSPKTLERALAETEAVLPELITLYTAGLEHQRAIMTMEQAEPWWAWAWRPGMMYLFAVLWLWNIVILHVFNAWLKIALPQTDLFLLFQLNGLYMALYMGGHTIKDALTKWTGARAGRT